MRATIRDVAKKSGYSITTVSMALNDKEVSLPKSTKDKIRKAAKTLDYRPNQLARSIITKKSKVLGLIIPDNANQFFAILSKAIEIEAHKSGYILIYGNSDNNSKHDLSYIRMFADHQVAGIIFTKSSSAMKKEDLSGFNYILENKIPFITLDRQIPNTSHLSVMLNHYKGGYLAAHHLIEQGHRRIACLTGPSDLISSNERLDGYKAVLAEHGINYDPELIYEGTYQAGHEKEALARFLEKKATAVFAFNDLMAFGIYREAEIHGLSIPGDISLIGFDNTPFCDIIRPGLTSVSQPVYEIGACAVRLLLELINKGECEEQTRTYLFEPELVLRESTKKI